MESGPKPSPFFFAGPAHQDLVELFANFPNKETRWILGTVLERRQLRRRAIPKC